MGHYRSEMGYEAEDAAEAKRKEERRRKLVANITRDVMFGRGIGEVLADIIEDTAAYRRKAES